MSNTELIKWIDMEIANGLRDLMQACANKDDGQWIVAWRKVECLREIRARLEVHA